MLLLLLLLLMLLLMLLLVFGFSTYGSRLTACVCCLMVLDSVLRGESELDVYMP